jgi:hypothetical protein
MSDNKIPGLPEIKFNKNGYEIRSDILGLAEKLVIEEYKAKLFGWEVSQNKDEEGKIVTTVTAPEFPGLEKVLETAQKMYDFVNQNPKK